MDPAVSEGFPQCFNDRKFDTNSPSSINFAEFVTSIRELKRQFSREKPAVLIVEGFLLFSDQSVVEEIDKFFYFDLSENDESALEEVCERKWKRKYLPFCSLQDFRTYWKLHPLPCYLKHGMPTKSLMQQKVFVVLNYKDPTERQIEIFLEKYK